MGHSFISVPARILQAQGGNIPIQNTDNKMVLWIPDQLIAYYKLKDL